jgi:hypothetical protein
MLSGAAIALFSLTMLPQAAKAQAAFTNPMIEWGLRTDVPRVPYDGASFPERYHYGIGAPLMLGARPDYLWYMYDMDRVDRALKFGYPLPAGVDPEALPPPSSHPHRRLGLGLGLGRWRY